MGFPRQEYWNELPFPSPGDLSNPGIKPTSPALAVRFFNAEPPGYIYTYIQYSLANVLTTRRKKKGNKEIETERSGP